MLIYKLLFIKLFFMEYLFNAKTIINLYAVKVIIYKIYGNISLVVVKNYSL